MLFNVQQPLVLLTLFKRCSEFTSAKTNPQRKTAVRPTQTHSYILTFTQTQTHDQKGVGCELNGAQLSPSPAS
jgi:hypothetical protein